MGFYLCQNTNIFNPLTVLTWLLSVNRTGQLSLKSVDRRAQNVHACLAGGTVDRPGRPQRASALWKSPVDRAGRPSLTASCQFWLPVDWQPPTTPTATFLISDLIGIFESAFSEILEAISWPIYLAYMMIFSWQIPINSGHWSIVKYKKNTRKNPHYLFVF